MRPVYCNGLASHRERQLDVESDDQIIRQVVAGDTSAFESLISRHGDSIHRFICGVLGDLHGAEDVAQQTWLNVHRNLGQFDSDRGSFKTWMLRIARNLAFNQLRKTRRSPVCFGTSLPDPVDPRSALDGLQIQEEFARLDAALAQLPSNQRSAWTLSELEGLTQREISQVEGVPEGTVKSRVSRAKAALRGVLQKQDELER
ncbi:MAG: RNA polymerase sigma factor [Planctomycetota bacterium]